MKAIQEAKALEQAGFEALILENFGDAPFYKSSVPPETVASMSIIAAAVREVTQLPLGINVLRNDARSALAIAACTGAEFVRVNVLSGVTATDQGLIEGEAASLIREKHRLAPGVAVLADAHVKHGVSLSSQDLEIAIEEVSGRGGAEGVIVTGATTGRLIDLALLEKAYRAARHVGTPLYLGSGATAENLPELVLRVNGLIVGSDLRAGGRAGAPLDLKRVKKFMQALKSATQKKPRTRKKKKRS